MPELREDPLRAAHPNDVVQGADAFRMPPVSLAAALFGALPSRAAERVTQSAAKAQDASIDARLLRAFSDLLRLLHHNLDIPITKMAESRPLSHCLAVD